MDAANDNHPIPTAPEPAPTMVPIVGYVGEGDTVTFYEGYNPRTTER